jgi:bilirubin oxidase
MKNLLFIALIIAGFNTAKGQNLIPIPDTLSGPSIDLFMADSVLQFFPGVNTHTIGYNGRYLGPTILLDKGQNVTMHVHNLLSDTTTTHWHGLHVAPDNDGSPHSPNLPGSVWSPSFMVMDNAATYIYHPHLHGSTMEQFLKGAAGLIIVRDQVEGALTLPRTYGIDDIPLVCQFQHIDSTSKQIILNDELDNITMVNGTINPMVNVPAQVVRFRILNASSRRVLQLGFNGNKAFYQITSDDGLLNAPVALTRLQLGSGERAEILVDFAGQSGNTFFIKQFGNELPSGYPGGPAGMGGSIGPFDNITFNFLQINVTPVTTSPVLSIPVALTSNTPWSAGGASSMAFTLAGSPMMSTTNFTINGVQYNENVINFVKHVGDVMIWNITNSSAMVHPWHIHGNHFFITSINGATPPLNMQGRKDVVLVPPSGGTVSLITKFEDFSDSLMPYMYHCHILSHEDKGMMGQFLVYPAITAVESISAIASGVMVFPNPSNGEFYVSDAKNSLREMQIYNTMGRIILDQSIDGGKVNIDLTKAAKGLYYVRVANGVEIKSFPIMVQ